MRLTTVILIASLMQVSAATFGQRITINQNDAPLTSIFKEIRKQSGYDFYYNSKDIPKTQTVTIAVTNASLDEALKLALKGSSLNYEIDGKIITIKKKEESLIDRIVARFQAIDVRGKVVDSLGNGLAGATVSVKNGKSSTSTSANGDFYLKSVDEGAILVVSYLGYVTRELVIGKEFINITMQQSESKLDEVQIQAYGVTTRRLSTGNITSIKAEDIAKQPINNPLLALQGRVAGLQVLPTNGLPGSSVSLQIRGRNTIRERIGADVQGTADPLIVIDGLPVQGNIQGFGYNGLGSISAISFINPNDIESIDILKDADATAIYGSRGANGVVLITTKKGRRGASNVQFNLQSGISEVSKRIDLLNTNEYLEIRKEALANSNLNILTASPSTTIADVKYWDQNRYTDWQKELLGNKGKYNEFQGSISGGNNNVQYLISGNYRKETSVFENDKFNRKANAFLSLTGSSLNDKLKTVLNVGFMNDLNTLPQRDFTELAMTLPPNAPALYTQEGTLNWELMPNGAASWTNPYASLLNIFETKVNNLTASGEISYELFPNLVVKSALGFNELRGNSFSAGTIAAASPSTINPVGVGTFGANIVRNLSIEPQLNYKTKIDKGNLDILIGGSYQGSSMENQSIRAIGFTSDALIRSYNAADPSRTSISNNSSDYKYAAIFSRLNYNWLGKYILNVNARRDGSSRFGPGSQFGYFGSGAAAWIFTEEEFLKTNLEWLSFGKIRASYGSTGNDGIGNYNYLERYDIIQDRDNYLGVKGFRSQGIVNQYYRWETVKKLELALETGFFNDRVLLSGTFFRNRSNDQLIEYPHPTTTGLGNLVSNLPALIQNSGYEFALNTQNIKGKNLTWSTAFNISIHENKLIAFPGIEESGYSSYLKIGSPFFGETTNFKYSGVNPSTGRYEFVLNDATISYDPNDPNRPDGGAFTRIMTNPKFFGGVLNSLSFKGFTLDVFFQFTKQIGVDPIQSIMPRAGQNVNLPIEYLNRWQKTGDITNIQMLFGRAGTEKPGYTSSIAWRGASDARYVDASFIRLKNVSFGYQIPKKFMEKMSLVNARIFVHGQNLLTITPYKGLDPETQSMTMLPPLRTITAGIQVGF